MTPDSMQRLDLLEPAEAKSRRPVQKARPLEVKQAVGEKMMVYVHMFGIIRK
jgi:hypothetical protein